MESQRENDHGRYVTSSDLKWTRTTLVYHDLPFVYTENIILNSKAMLEKYTNLKIKQKSKSFSSLGFCLISDK